MWHHRRSQPAISCLGAFRPPAIGVRGETVIPAAENLHKGGSARGVTTLPLYSCGIDKSSAFLPTEPSVILRQNAKVNGVPVFITLSVVLLETAS